MQEIEKINQFAEKHDIRFISCKFVDQGGKLLQIDVNRTNIRIDSKGYILVKDYQLEPIPNKYFIDPFRSIPTIFCLCNLVSSDYRNVLKNITGLIAPQKHHQYIVATKFFINNKEGHYQIDEIRLKLDDYKYQIDPVDQIANLRSEVADILHQININPVFHHHDFEPLSACIGIKCLNLLDVADNIPIICYIISNVAESYGKAVDFTLMTHNQNNANTITFQIISKDYNQVFDINLKVNLYQYLAKFINDNSIISILYS